MEGAEELVEALGKVLELVFEKTVPPREERKQKTG
jgi:hypothetical protein